MAKFSLKEKIMSSNKHKNNKPYTPKTSRATNQAKNNSKATTNKNTSSGNNAVSDKEILVNPPESKTSAIQKNIHEANQTSKASHETTVNINNSTAHKHTYPKMSKKQLWTWGISTVAITILVGVLAKILGGDMKHFEAHTLPPMTAPIWVFPIAWGILYPLIGIAGFLVFTSPNQTPQTRKWDIIWFSINLVLNMIWPLFFYRLDMLIVSTILCALVLISAAITCYRFYYRSLAGGILYTFYTLWLVYAFYLNLSICLINI